MYSTTDRRAEKEVGGLMEQELLLSEPFCWEGKNYLVQVYRRRDGKPRCSHLATTALGPDDYVISDGCSVEEVLCKQQTILPLAILSRSIVISATRSRTGCG